MRIAEIDGLVKSPLMTLADIQIEVIDCLDDLSRIEDDWNAVQDACDHKHVFLDHRFISAWWRHLGRGKSMHTLVLRRGGSVEGIVPLALSRGWEAFPTTEKNIRIAEDFHHIPAMRWRRVVPIRRLTFPLSFPSSNLRAHFLLREPQRQLIEAALSYCRTIRKHWDMLSLDGIPEASEQEALISGAAPRFGLQRGKSRHGRILLRAALPPTMEAFLKARSHNFRSGLKRAFRQSIEKTVAFGDFQIREFRGARLTKAWPGYSISNARAGRPGRRGSVRFMSSSTMRTAASIASHQGICRIGRCAGARDGDRRPAGNALCSLERQGMITCVLTYQAEEFAKLVTVAPLWSRFFEIAIERGLREVDFNGNSAYLARYADLEARFSRLTFYNSAFYSSLLRATADAANVLAHTFARR